MSTSKKIKYKPITKEDLSIENMKVRVNTWIDGEVVMALRERAKKEGTKYQTLMNSILRHVVLGEYSLEQRIEKLEAEVFRKKLR